jgi:multicomponent Na+:H+ antiporter subunit F
MIGDWPVDLVGWAALVALVAVSAALLLGALRLFLGPSLPDRIVALELLATILMGVSAIYAIAAGQPVFIDVAIALSLVAFMGAVAFVRFLSPGRRR